MELFETFDEKPRVYAQYGDWEEELEVVEPDPRDGTYCIVLSDEFVARRLPKGAWLRIEPRRTERKDTTN
jgi:hypothetical protein